ncbi:MAG: hypothetical protein M5R38_08230 [Candidatus Methylomirabilis sp.]|nr:hypothetical protein [Candidatus Methylomirabilis sp.]
MKEKQSWDEIVKASGLRPVVSDLFSWDRNLPQIPDQERFKEAALAMERGTISPIIASAKGAICSA